MKSFFRALGFMSSLPLGRLADFESRDIPRMLAMFPLAGAFLGGVLGVLWFFLLKLFGTQLSAALMVAAWALLTRGFHVDGLSDCADGIGGGYTPEKRLQIMKDPHIGVFGTIAIVCVLLLKFALLSALTFRVVESGGLLEEFTQSRQWLGRALMLGAILGVARLGPLILACGSEYARPEGGLGKDFVAAAKVWTLISGIIVTSTVALCFGGPFMLAIIGASLIFAVLLRVFFKRKLGGQTGDTMGASVELCEVVAMLAMVAGAQLQTYF